MKPQTLILRLPVKSENPNEQKKGKLQVCHFVDDKKHTAKIKARLLKFCSWVSLSFERGNQIHRQVQKHRDEVVMKQIRSGFPQRFL